MSKFLHAADLHIDSTLQGLQRYEGAPVDQLRGATRRATENLIRLAIEERVDFVIVAGDLFDGDWPDIRTGLWTREQFRRLERNGISVYLLRGNHDAKSVVCQTMKWPENVFEFSCQSPQTFRLESLGIALHGQGYEKRAETRDLAANYPLALPGYFNVGVLHTSLGGSAEHETYAPTSLEVLKSKGYDYWALGHIHTVDPLRAECDRPFVAYSGNAQGRHIGEQGAKGCRLVEVQGTEIVRNEFRATDVLRWQHVRIQLEPTDDLAAAATRAEEHLALVLANSEGRCLATRLTFSGSCEAHAKLNEHGAREEAVDDIRYRVRQLSDAIWVEKIEFALAPVVDWERLRQSPDLLGSLLRDIQELSAKEGDRAELLPSLQPLIAAGAQELREAGIDLTSPENIRRWISAAESMVVTGLLETDS